MFGRRPKGFVLITGLLFTGAVGVLLYVLAQSAIVTNDKTRSLALAVAHAVGHQTGVTPGVGTVAVLVVQG